MDTRINKSGQDVPATEREDSPLSSRHEETGVPRVTIADTATRVNREAGVKIDVRHTNFWYGSKQALYDVSIPIREKQVIALIGPSGCGKSTFLRTLNRMNDLIPGTRTEGEAMLDDSNIFDKSLDVVSLRQQVGMVFQRANPFPKSIFENVAYGLRAQRKSGEYIRERVEASLRGAALWDEVKDRLKSSALGLSGGQQQRLCIARAIAVSPEVLLLDEPASAIDPIATAAIEELMQTLKSRYTIVIVTHNMQQAARVADRTAFFSLDENEGRSAGTLVEFGDTELMFTRPQDRRTSDYVT